MQLLIRQYNNTTNRMEKERLFEEICEEVKRIAISICTKHHVSQNDIEDIQQEIRIKLYLVLPNYQEEKSQFTTLFYRIATNVARDYLRKITRQTRGMVYLQDDIDYRLLASQFEALNEIEFTKSFLSIKSLTANEKKVAKMIIKGFTKAEIADILGKSKTAISKTCTSVKNKYLQDLELAYQADSSFLFSFCIS